MICDGLNRTDEMAAGWLARSARLADMPRHAGWSQARFVMNAYVNMLPSLVSDRLDMSIVQGLMSMVVPT